MDLLAEIYAHKRLEVAQAREMRGLREVRAAAGDAPPVMDFVKALRTAPRPALIAEVKRASPRRGPLLPGLDPRALTGLYISNGAAAISVLTDFKYFQGSLQDLAAASQVEPRQPILRKDFIFDSYQVYETRAAGADALLLIAAMLAPELLADLYGLARSLGLAVLIEVHNQAELAPVLALQPALVGVNNRDLRTFTTNLETTLELRPHIPSQVCLVSESGIHNRDDVLRLAAAGVDAILVGESLVRAADIGAQVRSLAGI